MTITTYEVPLSPVPQKITIRLNNNNYKLTVVWNFASECWVLNIDTSLDVPVIHGIPLVLGTNLLGQFEYLGIGGILRVQMDNADGLPPSFSNLGIDGHLYFEVEDNG
jgi:hypothetical protein